MIGNASILRIGLRLAVRNLLQDTLRLALSVVGVALAVMLILFIFGLRQGVFDGTSAYLRHSPGSIVVMPAGVDSTMAVSGKFLPSGTEDAIAGIPGIEHVSPVLRTTAIPEFHGRKEFVIVIGYDPEAGGGPWKLFAGRHPTATGEVVLDRVLADRHGLHIGDVIEVKGKQLTVVGLSKETSSWIGAYLFAGRETVSDLALMPGASNLIFVSTARGATEQVQEQIEQLSGLSVVPKNELIQNDQAVLGKVFDQVLAIMVAAAFVVGALVVGMVVYTATVERGREYGVLKAIGSRNTGLYFLVLVQALAAAIAGVMVGVGFAFLMGRIVMALRPQFLVTIEPPMILQALAAGVVMAMLGAVLPTRTIAGLAPADVFRK